MVLTVMRDHLDDDERNRAARFANYRDRQRFVMSHFALRQLLSGACGTHASELRFTKEPFGRPFLSDPSGMDFNMSRAHDNIAAYAVSGNGRVGIDIEMIVPALAKELAQHVLAPMELNALRQMPSQMQTAAFFRCWTAKEAFLKLHGRGFSVKPQAVVVDLDKSIASCNVPELLCAHIVWLPTRGSCVCALATLNAVHLHDVSPWLTRCVSLAMSG
jgi:4'-phosphopantetheinyl transferase